MPIPKFVFTDAPAGLPRAPVPVRYACMAANWSPALLAEVVCGAMNESRPLLTVFEYDPTFKRSGEVSPEAYEGYRNYRGQPQRDQLARLPINHYVWSDALISANSDLVDLTVGRDQADGQWIRWEVALGDCADIVAESIDLSELNLLEKADPRLRISAKACLSSYERTQGQFKDSKGVRYIVELLRRPAPAKALTVSELDMLVNPSLATSATAEATIADMAGEADFEDAGIRIGNLSGGTELMDQKGIDDVTARLKLLKQRIDEAKARGNQTQLQALQTQHDELAPYLGSVANKSGAPRKVDSSHDQARKKITNGIARAIKAIKVGHPELGGHLEESISTGSYFSYRPKTPVRWEITVTAAPPAK